MRLQLKTASTGTSSRSHGQDKRAGMVQAGNGTASVNGPASLAPILSGVERIYIYTPRAYSEPRTDGLATVTHRPRMSADRIGPNMGGTAEMSLRP